MIPIWFFNSKKEKKHVIKVLISELGKMGNYKKTKLQKNDFPHDCRGNKIGYEICTFNLKFVTFSYII